MGSSKSKGGRSMFVPLRRAGAALGRRRLLMPLGATARRFARCTSGISSVEFVIVLFPMVLFMFGIIGFGLVFYTYNTMENAAREAVRRMSVAEATYTLGPQSCTSAAAQIAPILADPAAVPPKPGVPGSAEWWACRYLTATWLTYSVDAGESCPAERNVTVRIETSGAEAFVMDFLGIFGADHRLAAEVTLRKEEACA